jgi:hypothetical protein
MEIALMLTWFGLIIAIIAITIEWSDIKERVTRTYRDEIVNALYLLNNGWKYKDLGFRTSFYNCAFIAPDETNPRGFVEAVERQRKLDEIAKYNLPPVTEPVKSLSDQSTEPSYGWMES